MNPDEKKNLEARIIEKLRTCYDPEIPVNIYDMGLIYATEISDAGEVMIKMTLTSPYCPAIRSLPGEIESKVRDIQDVASVRIEIVWEPQWDPGRMSEAARLELGIF